MQETKEQLTIMMKTIIKNLMYLREIIVYKLTH